MKILFLLIASFCCFNYIAAQPIQNSGQRSQAKYAKFPGRNLESAYLPKMFYRSENAATETKIKSSDGGTYLKDSTYWFGWDEQGTDWDVLQREVSVYNNDGNEIQNKTDTWNPNSNVFIPRESNVKSYYPDGNIEEIIYYTWNSTSMTYNAYHKAHYRYNSNSQETEIISFSWNSGTSEWHANFKQTISYNIIGQETERVGYEWDETLNDWIFSQKNSNTYDSIYHLVEYSYFTWDLVLNSWKNEEKDTYSYNTSGNLVEHINYKRNESMDSIFFFRKQIFAYDSASNRIEDISFLWKDETNEWLHFSRHTYAFDTNDNNTEQITYFWEETISGWLMYSKFDFTYSIDNQPTQILLSNWESGTQTWRWSFKEEYQYNTDGQLLEEASYFCSGGIWFGIQKREYSYDQFENQTSMNTCEWDYNNSSWIYISKLEYYYSLHQITEVNDNPETGNILVYPVPAKDVLMIKNLIPGSKISIFDGSGKLILNCEAKSVHENLNIGNLAKGTYILKITNSNSVTSSQFLKL